MNRTGLSWAVRWALCLLLPLFTYGAAAAQQGTITGRITDERGAPMAGAQVSVEGTELGNLSNAEGRYLILRAPAGRTVVRVTRLGYGSFTRTVTVPSEGTVTADFQLKVEAIQLEGIVAVGYGTQQKVNVTGAVAAVDGEKLATLPVPNVSTALQGMAPGLQIVDQGGGPGRNGGDILIRGQTTLGRGSSFGNMTNRNTSRPLIMVDGIEGTMDALDVEDIENISILKDASSAAIYGSRAANGVILITTKRGAARDGLQITYDGFFGMQSITTFPEEVSIADHMRLTNVAYVNAGRAPKYSDEYIQKTLSGEDPLRYPTVDWVDEVFDPAPIQDHTLRLSGGNDAARYALSLNYMKEDGMVANTGADRYGVRLNTDFRPTDRISGGVDIAANRRWYINPSREGDVYFYLIHDTPPTEGPAHFPDGSYGFSSTKRSPVAAAEASGERQRATWLGTATGRLNYDLVPGWAQLQTTASFTYDHYVNNEFRTQQNFYDYFNPSTLLFSWSPNRLWRDVEDQQQLTLRALVDYGHTFNDAHNISGVIGYEQITQESDDFGTDRQQFYNNELRVLDLGNQELDANSGGFSEWALQSGFGRIAYSYLSRYLLEANARYDGSSRFAEANRFGFFPSFSAAWRISEEPFFNLGFVNELKLRGSWGELGNQDVGLYQYFSTLSLNQPYWFGSGLQTGAAKSALTNADITWETTTAKNVGFDAAFLNNRLTLTGDVYVRETKDILLNLPIPALVGRSASVQNAGVVENRGWEVAVGWRDQIGEVNYNFDFNLSDNRNKVLDLAGTGPYTDWDQVIKVGHPINSWYMYRALGLFQSEEEVAGWATQAGNTKPGDVKWEDQNDDGLINELDKVVVGDPAPHYLFGVNLGLNWRQLDFSAFLQGVGQRDQRIELGLAEGPMWENFTTSWHLDYWTPENRDARVPAPVIHENYNTHWPSTWWMQDASYVKLRTVQLGYSLPGSLTGRLGVDRLRLYVIGKNLWQTSGMEIGLDPEVAAVRGNFYPQTKSITVGTNVTF